MLPAPGIVPTTGCSPPPPPSPGSLHHADGPVASAVRPASHVGGQQGRIHGLLHCGIVLHSVIWAVGCEKN